MHMMEQLRGYRISRQMIARRIACVSQLLDPLLHHLHVAQFTQRLEKFPSRLLHVLP